MLVYGKYECRHADVVCLCLVCILLKSSMLGSVSQFVNAGRGCKRPPYARVILQGRSHDCLVGSHECLLLLLLYVEVCVRVLRCCECVCCM